MELHSGKTSYRGPSAIREPLHILKDIFAGWTIQELVKHENSVTEGFGHHGCFTLIGQGCDGRQSGMTGRSSAGADEYLCWPGWPLRATSGRLTARPKRNQYGHSGETHPTDKITESHTSRPVSSLLA